MTVGSYRRQPTGNGSADRSGTYGHRIPSTVPIMDSCRRAVRSSAPGDDAPLRRLLPSGGNRSAA